MRTRLTLLLAVSAFAVAGFSSTAEAMAPPMCIYQATVVSPQVDFPGEPSVVAADGPIALLWDGRGEWAEIAVRIEDADGSPVDGDLRLALAPRSDRGDVAYQYILWTPLEPLAADAFYTVVVDEPGVLLYDPGWCFSEFHPGTLRFDVRTPPVDAPLSAAVPTLAVESAAEEHPVVTEEACCTNGIEACWPSAYALQVALSIELSIEPSDGLSIFELLVDGREPIELFDAASYGEHRSVWGLGEVFDLRVVFTERQSNTCFQIDRIDLTTGERTAGERTCIADADVAPTTLPEIVDQSATLCVEPEPEPEPDLQTFPPPTDPGQDQAGSSESCSVLGVRGARDGGAPIALAALSLGLVGLAWRRRPDGA